MKKQLVYEHLPHYQRRKELVSIEKRIIALVEHAESEIKKQRKDIIILKVGCGLRTLSEDLTRLFVLKNIPTTNK